MLGNTNTQNFFASSHFIQLYSNVWAEWNYNNIFQPFAISTQPFDLISGGVKAKQPLYLTASWQGDNFTISAGYGRSSINSNKIIPTGDYFLSGSAGNNTSTQISMNNLVNQITASTSYTFPSGSERHGFYKIVFFVSKNPVYQYETIALINTASAKASGFNPSSASYNYTYKVQAIGKYGNVSSLLNNNSASVVNNQLGGSIYNTVSWQPVGIDSIGYKVYRGVSNKNKASSVSYKYLGSSTTSSYKDVVFNPANNNDNAIYTSDIYITPSVQILDSSGNTIDSDFYIKFSNNSGGELETNNSTIRINGITWQKVEIYLTDKIDVSGTGISSPISKINISLNASSPIQGQSFYVTPLWLYDISQFDYFNNNLFPAESIFAARRPGEGLLNPFISTTNADWDLYTDKKPGDTVSRGLTYSFYNPNTIYTNSSRINMIPSIYNKYKYYVSNELDTSNNNFSGISAFYDQYLDINKFIVKINNSLTSPKTDSASLILYFNTSAGAASSMYIPGPFSFDNNGISIFYYSNNAWYNKSGSDFAQIVKSSASSGNAAGGWLPPTIQNNGQISTNAIFKNLTGFNFICSTTLNSNSISDGDNRLHIVEISPRLEIDITPYVENYSISKELDRTAGAASFPMGYISSNDGSLRINNFPVIYNELPFTIFENKNTKTTFYDLLKQGIKFTGYLWSPPDRFSFSEAIPTFTMYSDIWRISDTDAVDVTMFDSLKHYAMSTESSQYYAKGENLYTIITHLLEMAGFSDYSKKELYELCGNKTSTPFFWTDENKTVFECLQELFIAHQIGAFINEAGFLRFINIDNVIDRKVGSNFDFSISDTTHAYSPYWPNLVESTYNENISPRIGKVIVNYSLPNTSISPTVNNVYNSNSVILTDTKRQVFQEETDAALAHTKLNSSMNINDNTFIIDDFADKIARNNPGNYSGTFFIGGEAVKAEGMQYQYSYKDDSGNDISFPYVIKNNSDREEAKANVISLSGKGEKEITETITNKFVGVSRGMYGTTIKPHIICSDMNTFQKYFAIDTQSIGNSSAAIIDNELSINMQSKNSVCIVTPIETIKSNYNHYSITFSVPLKNATDKYIDSECMSVGCYWGYDGGYPINFTCFYLQNTGDGNTKLVFGQLINSKSSLIKFNNSDYVLLDKNLFDGKQHRFSIWFDNNQISYRIDDEKVISIKGKFNLSLNAPITFNSKNKYAGFFAASQDANGKSDPKSTFTVNLQELYTCDWPKNRSSKVDLFSNPKYHFQTRTFLDSILETTTYETNYQLWQSKPRVIGFKHYSNEKFIAAPAVSSNFTYSFAGYDTALSDKEIENGGLYGVFPEDLAVSTPISGPFLFNQIVVNNTGTVQRVKYGPTMLLLNSQNGSLPAGGGQNVTISPYELEAEVLNFTTDKKLEKIISINHLSNSVQLKTDWIQNERDAENIVNKMSYLLPTFNSEVSLDIFGNPLPEVGDICSLWFKLKGIGFDSNGNPYQNGQKYFVNSINQTWDGSLKTSLVLKQL